MRRRSVNGKSIERTVHKDEERSIARSVGQKVQETPERKAFWVETFARGLGAFAGRKTSNCWG